MDLNTNLKRINEAISLLADRPDVDPAVLNKGLDLIEEIVRDKRSQIAERSSKAAQEAFGTEE